MYKYLLSLTLFLSCTATGNNIETITVSATPVDLEEAGASVDVITREDILLSNLPTLQELLRTIPGFSVSQQGSAGALTQLRVRGAESNQVLVLIDGIEANDLSQGSEFDFSKILTGDIERIEVVRGPQSALWGSDAMAGVVHIITNPGPGTRDNGFEALGQRGTFGTLRSALSYRRVTERSRVKVSLDHLDTEGTNISRKGREDDGYDNTTLNLSGSLGLSSKLDASYTVRYTDTSTEFDALDKGLPVDADHVTEAEQLYAGIGFSHRINGKLGQRFTLTGTKMDNNTDTGGEVGSTSRGEKKTAKYQLDYIDGQHRFSLLAEREKEHHEQRGTAPGAGVEEDLAAKSLAFEYRLDRDRLDLSFGARLDDNADFDNASAWRATLNWRTPSGHAVLHASAGESVKNPTFTERFAFFGSFIGNPDLEPEESFGWEVGIKGSFLDDKLTIGLTGFDADLRQEINGFVYDPAVSKFTAKNIDGDSERKGIELQVSHLVSGKLELAGHYTYLHARQEGPGGGEITEIRRPKHSGSIFATYRFNRGNIRLAVSYTGEQVDDYFPPFPLPRERVYLDAFTLVGLSGQYHLNDSITLDAGLENATDEDYEQVFGYRSPGIGGHLGVRFRW